MGFMIKKSYKD